MYMYMYCSLHETPYGGSDKASIHLDSYFKLVSSHQHYMPTIPLQVYVCTHIYMGNVVYMHRPSSQGWAPKCSIH